MGSCGIELHGVNARRGGLLPMLRITPTPLRRSASGTGYEQPEERANGAPTATAANQHEPPTTRSDRIIVIITDRKYWGCTMLAIGGIFTGSAPSTIRGCGHGSEVRSRILTFMENSMNSIVLYSTCREELFQVSYRLYAHEQ